LGLLLSGDPFDLEDWQGVLKQPFEPWVTKTDEGLILRSQLLDTATTSTEANDLGGVLLARVNGALSASHKPGTVRLEAVMQFRPDGSRMRFNFLAMRANDGRDRMRATVVVTDPDGNPLPPPPPEPSAPQRWLSIAAEDDLLADALTFFGRSDNWFDVYKTLECLIGRFGGGKEDEFLALGWESKTKIGLLKRTADFWRHSPRGRPKVVPPPNPMEQTEARDLLAKLMARAFQEATRANLAKPTTPG
jgi:hypothetical protein